MYIVISLNSSYFFSSCLVVVKVNPAVVVEVEGTPSVVVWVEGTPAVVVVVSTKVSAIIGYVKSS